MQFMSPETHFGNNFESLAEDTLVNIARNFCMILYVT